MKTPLRVSLAIACLGLAVIFGLLMRAGHSPDAPVPAKPDITADFTLIDQHGRRVSSGDFAGRYMLVYFGFTFCPDICPLGLQTMSDALDRFDGTAIDPVFITVDPERDTPEAMRDYVAHFHPRLIGLTGSPDAIAHAARGFKVFYRKVPDPDAPDDYTVDHSSIFYLMSPDGTYLAHFDHNATAETMADKLAALTSN